jgi:hypothetical protein
VLCNAGFNGSASFLGYVSGVSTRHLKCASENYALANQRPVCVAFAPDGRARANPASATLNPLFNIEARFCDGPQ